MEVKFEWDEDTAASNEKTMKKTRTTKKNTRAAAKPAESEKDMLPEYRFDYSKARPNRFAGRMPRGSNVVVLPPDLAEAFPTAEAVREALRDVIALAQRVRKRPSKKQ